MAGRTYRYFKGEPLYPFGFGLSYTKFGYSKLKFSSKSVKTGEPIKVTVDVKNTGARDGDEVVQLYLTDVAASAPVPIRALVGFDRISLRAGQKQTVAFTIAPRQMSLIDDRGKRVIEPGEFAINIGGMSARFQVSGKLTELPER
jgi:beta-glucosidase